MVEGRLRTHAVLILLTAVSSAISWWPGFFRPDLHLSFWVPLGCVVLCTGLTMLLAPSIWPVFVFASGFGTFVGICLGSVIWPVSDPIAGAWVPYLVPLITLVVMFITLGIGWILRRRSISL